MTVFGLPEPRPIEDASGILKIDRMLGKIGLPLALVPFEKHPLSPVEGGSVYVQYVHTRRPAVKSPAYPLPKKSSATMAAVVRDHSVAVGTVAGVTRHFRRKKHEIGLIWIEHQRYLVLRERHPPW